MHFPRKIKRLTVAATLIGALLGGGSLIASSSADLQSQIQANKSAASSLQGEINSESAQIEKTAGGVAAAQQKLSIEQTDLNQHITELRQVQTQLMQARDRLLALETKLRIASTDLASNLRAAYENGSPNLIDVILNAHGFSNLLEQVNYLKDAQHQDARVVNYTKIARAEVLKEATHLGKLELQDRDLTNQILSQRNQVAALEIGLAKQQIDQESQRSHDTAKLASVNSSTQALQQKLAQQQRAIAAREAAAAAAARQTPEQVNQQVGGLSINPGGAVQPPPGAPAAVGQMMAAGNAIATLPYIWGGGHGSFISPGYDCSGSVSYVLAAAGLLSSPETSGGFESYGDPGPGQWVTLYANAGHVWMTIAGWRFDTVALAEDGTRWSQGGGEYGGFVVRHPPGL
jgi:peptidoglycan hydrolase CwlO-like protein